PSRTDDAGLWYADGDMVRSAYTPRAEDDDFGQARTQIREVLDDDARDRLVSNVAGHLSEGVSDKVLARAFPSRFFGLPRVLGRGQPLDRLGEALQRLGHVAAVRLLVDGQAYGRN